MEKYNRYTMMTLNLKAFLFMVLIALAAGHRQQLYKVIDGDMYAIITNLMSILGVFAVLSKTLKLRTIYILINTINFIDILAGLPLVFGHVSKEYVTVYYAITMFASTSSFILSRQIMGHAIDTSTLSMRDISGNDVYIGALGALFGMLIGLWFNYIPTHLGVFTINSLFGVVFSNILYRFWYADKYLVPKKEKVD